MCVCVRKREDRERERERGRERERERERGEWEREKERAREWEREREREREGGGGGGEREREMLDSNLGLFIRRRHQSRKVGLNHGVVNSGQRVCVHRVDPGREMLPSLVDDFVLHSCRLLKREDRQKIVKGEIVEVADRSASDKSVNKDRSLCRFCNCLEAFDQLDERVAVHGVTNAIRRSREERLERDVQLLAQHKQLRYLGRKKAERAHCYKHFENMTKHRHFTFNGQRFYLE